MRRFLPILILLCACEASQGTGSPEPTAEPFVDQTLSETHVSLSVRSGDTPVANAIVMVRAPLDGDEVGPVMLTAMTDPSGEAEGIFTRRADQEEFDVVVVKDGFEGALPGDMRAQLGDFAPAAIVRADIQALSATRIDLTKKGTP